jgi:N-sulfoglucosamine sulfohydrolase
MTRRRFLMQSAAGAVAGAFASCGPSIRPNFLWITCEDMSPLLGCYGDSYAYTPNLDRLAAQGVRYTHAFATASVCTPARSCLITGLHANSLGTHNLRGEMPLPDTVRCYPEFLRNAGYYCTNNAKEDYNFATPETVWDESSESAHWNNGPPGQPFFSIFNLMMTHQGQIRYPRQRLDEINAGLPPEARHDPARALLPPYYPDTPGVRANIAALYTQVTLMDQRAGQILTELEEDGLASSTIVFFYSDHGTGLPRGKRWLHDSGIRVPLIIRFPERFQYLAPAPPGATIGRLVGFVDFPPTMLSLAGLSIPDYMQGSPFLGRQTTPPREYIFASADRVDEALECSRTVRDARYQYIRNYLPHRPRMPYSDFSELTPVRKELRRLHAQGKLEGDTRWLMEPCKPPEELYDTEADPHEIRNLAASPEHAEILQRLRGALQDWIVEVRDTGLLPEPDLARRSGDASPYVMTGDSHRFPVERIRDAAELVGRGPAELPNLQQLLADPDSAVRYWAAVGLTALGPDAAPAAGALRQALGDASPVVRIAAAEALLGLDPPRDAAVNVLRDALLTADSRLQLHAVTVFIALGEMARPAIDTLKSALSIPSRPEQQREYAQWGIKGILQRLRAT